MNEIAEDRQSFIFRFCTTMTAYRADEEAGTVAKTGLAARAAVVNANTVNTAWQSAILQKEELYE